MERVELGAWPRIWRIWRRGARQHEHHCPEIHPRDIGCRYLGRSDKATPLARHRFDTVSENPQNNEKSLKKAMEKMFRKYLPEVKK